jgi:hypothetical protein
MIVITKKPKGKRSNKDPAPTSNTSNNGSQRKAVPIIKKCNVYLLQDYPQTP